MKVTIRKKTFEQGQEVAYYIGDKMYERGYVRYGLFHAEIYEVFGWFVADSLGNQVSEAGLTDDYEILTDKNDF